MGSGGDGGAPSCRRAGTALLGDVRATLWEGEGGPHSGRQASLRPMPPAFGWKNQWDPLPGSEGGLGPPHGQRPRGRPLRLRTRPWWGLWSLKHSRPQAPRLSTLSPPRWGKGPMKDHGSVLCRQSVCGGRANPMSFPCQAVCCLSEPGSPVAEGLHPRLGLSWGPGLTPHQAWQTHGQASQCGARSVSVGTLAEKPRSGEGPGRAAEAPDGREVVLLLGNGW